MTQPASPVLVTGLAPITHAEIAAALTSALGRDVTFIDVAPDVFAESLRRILPPWQIQGLLEDYAHYRRGEATSVSPAGPHSASSNSHTTTPPRSPPSLFARAGIWPHFRDREPARG
jgi:hypothetical protein